MFPPDLLGYDKKLIKYWVFPRSLFEFKKDKYGIAAFIYENLKRASIGQVRRRHHLDPYIRVGSDKELVEIEDNIAIRTLGVITPTTSFFRGKILFTPIEREITYRQFSSLAGATPDLYAGSFTASISEVSPRSVPLPRPYVSVPPLSIKILSETVLLNSLGYALLSLYPAEKSKPQFEVSFMPLNDAVELECAWGRLRANRLKGANQRKVA